MNEEQAKCPGCGGTGTSQYHLVQWGKLVACKKCRGTGRITENRGSQDEASSLRRMGRRDAGTKTIQASKWWGLEGREKGVWTSVIAGETSSKRDALMALEDLRKTMPLMQWRVVEVVERRTVIRVTRASSPTEKLRDDDEQAARRPEHQDL